MTTQYDVALEPMAQDSVPGSAGKPLFLRRYEHPQAEYLLVLVHGTAGHSEVYHDFAEYYRRNYPVTVWSFDLTGHGRTPGPRGVFTFEDFLEDTRLVVEKAVATGIPVVLHGASQGGEVAFHAIERCPGIVGAVCMNILLNDEIQMEPAIRLLRSKTAAWIAEKFGDRIRIPLHRSVRRLKAAYQEDPDMLPKKLADPYYVWSYGLSSYRTVFTYRPPRPAAANTTPILIACGANDEIVKPEHVRACFERIGGPKDLFVMPSGGHQLMLFETDVYSKVVDSWVQERALGKATSWTAPIDAEEQTFFDFLGRERRNEAEGEPEYRYSRLDRLLTWASNGTIERGVRYFSQANTSAQWAFSEEVVSKIDYSAWDFLAAYLPLEPSAGRGRLAVGGCGRGILIQGLADQHPELRDWEVHGFDVDYKAIRAGRRRFADNPNVQMHVGDIRDHDVLGEDEFDAVYLHGIFDHCTEHRAVLESAYRALKPGGRVFYVAPDRNFYTWVSFVTVGPLYVSGLYKSIHDFRRFPRPAEISALLEDVGFTLVPKNDEPGSPAIVGLEYQTPFNPIALARALRVRDLSAAKFQHTKPRRWLGGGYLGEYVGAAEKPPTTSTTVF